MNSHLKGSLLIVAAMFFFALQGVFSRIIDLAFKSFFAYYELFFLIILSIVLVSTKRYDQFKIHHSKLLLLASGIFVLLTTTTYLLAYRLTTFANVTLTHYTAPICAFVIAIIFLKEKFEWKSLFAIIFSMVGILLLFRITNLSTHLTGITLGLLSGLFYGILINLNKKLADKGNVQSIMFYQTIPIVVIFFPFLFTNLPSLKSILLLVTLAITSVLAATLYLTGLKTVKAQHIGIISYTDILFVVLFGFFIFGEIPGKMIWIGGSLIIISGIWIMIGETKRR